MLHDGMVSYALTISFDHCIIACVLAVAAADTAHGRHWAFERAVAGSLYAVIPAAYIMPPSFGIDTALSAVLVLHAHW